MCGIMGYAGQSSGMSAVLEGLTRLEYRGYDSAGVSYVNEGKINIIKREGKLDNLKSVLNDLNINSQLVIGHTRWATHGKVNETNAHPHGDDEIAVVHNGIIENSEALKESLLTDYAFKSQTDSEVFFALVKTFRRSHDLDLSIIKAFKEVEGNSSFVIISKDSNKIYGIKRSAPLVAGYNSISREIYLSSDPYAMVGFADKVIFPDDEVLVVGDYRSDQEMVSYFELDQSPSKRFKIQEQAMNSQVVSKGNFEHFMLKEIYEQPILIKNLTESYSSLKESTLKELAQLDCKHMYICACGTALHAGYIIRDFIERFTDIRVEIDYASEFRYKKRKLHINDVGLFISQSGETADTLACQELCVEAGMKTISIVNVEGSTLFRNSSYNLLIHAGVEIGVASTKAFTQQVMTGLILSKALEGISNLNDLEKEFQTLSQKFQYVLESQVDKIKEIAKEIYNHKGFIFTGRGEQFPVALEGALKLKEIAYVHAEGYAAGELKHGPISLIDEEMVNLAIITPDLFNKTISNAQEVKARGGRLIVIGEKNNKQLKDLSEFYIELDFNGLEYTRPLLTNLVLQLFSYYVAKLKGTDIDKPRNLAKSVTVE